MPRMPPNKKHFLAHFSTKTRTNSSSNDFQCSSTLMTDRLALTAVIPFRCAMRVGLVSHQTGPVSLGLCGYDGWWRRRLNKSHIIDMDKKNATDGQWMPSGFRFSFSQLSYPIRRMSSPSLIVINLITWRTNMIFLDYGTSLSSIFSLSLYNI